ncbi:trace amine-associated receptor 13c-like [Electrophorus electricus]|uniref:trace amine-associated receptor 13c-like n=1 Tax=Electrophorus electricus TaxID=8005 RepID=UPI0015D06721|nr:trace amine-associated receptor 13c-like [Electrophorus electricus]
MLFMNLNQTDYCLRFSCPERAVSSALYVFSYVSTAAVVFLTVCGNLLIIISVCHFKQLHTPTNMLILSLAVSDCLVGVFVIPTALIWMIESCWIFGGLYRICFTFMSYFLTGMSIFNIALIAVDRYFALSKPFLYNKTVSLSTMCSVLLSIWILLFLYNIALQYFNGGFVSYDGPEDYFLVLNQVWYLIDLFLIFVIPLSVIVILYVQVFFIAKKHATAIRELNSHTRTQTSKNMSDSMKSERKAAKVLGILVSVFLACLLPYFVYNLLGNIELEPFQKVLLLVYINSSINPVIYALFYPWFRRAVKLIFTLQIFNTDSALINVLY